MDCDGTKFSCVRSYPSIHLNCYERDRVGQGDPIVQCILNKVQYICYNAMPQK